MKKTLLVATAFAFSITAIAQTATKTQTKPQAAKEVKATEVKSQTLQTQAQDDKVVKFNTHTHDFGKIKHNVPVTYFFEIKNISDKPVVVENSYSTCGCTTPEKIVEPILPGATAKLKVVFNAASIGPINKDVFIKIAGIDQPKTVKITGEVVAAEPPKEEKNN